MKERAYQLNPATQDCLIATFHSMCVRILRRDADHIGYNRNLPLLTQVSNGPDEADLEVLELDPNGMNDHFGGPFPMPK